MSASSGTRAADAGRAERELTLKAAAEMTGSTGKVLRRYIREGRLRPASVDGNRLTVTLAALREAGLLPALPLQATRPGGPDAADADDGDDDDATEAEARDEADRQEHQSTERARAAADAAQAESARLEAEAAERQRAERERERGLAEREREQELAEREQRERGLQREKAQRDGAASARAEKDARDKAERDKAERARVEKDARDKAGKAQADKARAEKDAREKAERARAEKDAREKADRARAEKEARERADREQAEKARVEKAGRERAEAEAEAEAEASKVVPLSRGRAPQLEDLDDVDETDDRDDASELDERDLDEIEGELDDLSDDDAREATSARLAGTVRLEPEPSMRIPEGRVVTEVRGETIGPERSMVVAGSGPFVTSNQMADLMRLLAAEREARAQEWLDRTESLYREMLETQRLRITSLEDEAKAMQGKLEEALRLVPKGENFQALEQMIRDLRIELDRKEAARADMEHERDRLRDLTDRLRNDLSRAEKRNLEMAEQLRRFRAQGIFDRMVGREPDDPK